MQFTTFRFLFFFPFVVLAYYLFDDKWKNKWLLVVNYYFYMCFGVIWAVLLQIVTMVSYFAGIAIEETVTKNSRGIGRKKILMGSIGGITILCVVKHSHPSTIFLPIGISFYLLQAIGYVIDVYEGKIAAERDYIQYTTFLSFFPTIQSGPIEKAEHFLPQLQESRRFDYDNVKNGLLLMLWGYFEKMVVADLAGILVDSVYSDYKAYSGGMLIIATVLYAFQIYADFDGYSNIAVGAAQVLGFDMVRNFRQPYFADGMKEFWKRWHISLSNWLKEYVYIPLGGSRCGNRYANIMITFVVSGLWHGGSLHYLVWGVLHGFFQAVESIMKSKEINRGGLNGAVIKAFKILITFFLVDFAWLFFRASDLSTAVGILNKIFQGLGNLAGIISEGVGTGISFLQIFFISMGLICMFAVDIMHVLNWKIREKVARLPIAIRWGLYYSVLLILLIILIANMGVDAANFIYGQF